jgi:site-specific DNA-methyltransferase (adenine-specific)
MKTKLMLGDNILSLKKLPENSVDSIVSDPPYGLSFMGKKWDYDVPSVEFWKEVYRVLKPGGHVLSFGGTRTYHRMTVNIEDAGFEIRDQIMWLYGSGFPKSHNIGKAVDKLQGNDREVIETKKGVGFQQGVGDTTILGKGAYEWQRNKGQSPYEGWGTALKPANEPICVARKPLSEKSVAENVLKWGTGGINIDGCRVGSEVRTQPVGSNDSRDDETLFGLNSTIHHKREETTEGRFPANIILECLCDEVIKGEVKRSGSRDRTKHDYNSVGNFGSKEGAILAPDNYNDKGDIHTNPMCPCYLMDEQSGVSKSSKGLMKSAQSGNDDGSFGGGLTNDNNEYNDKGGASRFFYQAKVSKQERNMGLDVFEGKKLHSINQLDDRLRPDGTLRETPIHKNNHPTVKPVALMSYLVRLVTPPNGIVLDPFMGSGSTGISAQLEGFRFVGMEMDPDYFKIAEARINSYEEYKKFIK